MAQCPFAQWRPLDKDRSAIVPTQFIMHSIVGSAEAAYAHFQRTNLESHFILKKDGELWQLMDTERRAQANSQANVRAVSVETEDNGDPDNDPWTFEQLSMLERLARWLHEVHGIPLVQPTSWTDPGVGYHRMFPQWYSSPRTCPGNIRVMQFLNELMPVLEGDDVLNEEKIRKIFREELSRAFGGGGWFERWVYRILLYAGVRNGAANSYINDSSMSELFDRKD